MSVAPQRTLILGGAGFLGACLVASRLRHGDAVHVVTRPTTDLRRLAGCRYAVTVHHAALTDRSALDRLLAAVQPDAIYHLAAPDRRRALPDLEDVRLSITEDLAGLATLVAACAAAARPPRVLVRAGSLAEYGAIAVPYVEDQCPMPQNAYAAALAAGTGYAAMMADRLPFALVTARLALLYGAGQSERFLVPQLIGQALARRRFTINRPYDRRDLMHVDDAVAGLEALAASPVLPVVNLSTGTSLVVLDVARQIYAGIGADPGLLDLGPRFATGGTPDICASAALASRRLGWRPRIAFEDGLAMTIAWYRDQGDQGEQGDRGGQAEMAA